VRDRATTDVRTSRTNKEEDIYTSNVFGTNEENKDENEGKDDYEDGKWIDILQYDVHSGKSLMKEFEDEWNINNSDDDIDDKSGEKSDNSDNVRDNGIKKTKEENCWSNYWFKI